MRSFLKQESHGIVESLYNLKSIAPGSQAKTIEEYRIERIKYLVDQKDKYGVNKFFTDAEPRHEDVSFNL